MHYLSFCKFQSAKIAICAISVTRPTYLVGYWFTSALGFAAMATPWTVISGSGAEWVELLLVFPATLSFSWTCKGGGGGMSTIADDPDVAGTALEPGCGSTAAGNSSFPWLLLVSDLWMIWGGYVSNLRNIRSPCLFTIGTFQGGAIILGWSWSACNKLSVWGRGTV